MKENKKGLYIKIGIILICAAIYFFVQPVKIGINQAWTMLRMLNVDVARNYILSFDIWAPIVSFLLMVFQSLIVPLPAFIITFANAGLFGWIRGAVLSWSSTMSTPI